MKRAYLLAYSDQVGEFEAVKVFLNSMRSVETWRKDLPHVFYLISEQDAKEIARELRALSPNGRFIVTEIPDNSSGWLTPDSWFLIQNLRHKPKQ